MTLVTPHDLAIISLGAHYASKAHHLGEAETEVSRRVNFPRRMNPTERHLVTLKIMKMRFNDMGENLPREYADELERAYPARQVFCQEDNCVVCTDVQRNVFLNRCVHCDFSYCLLHMPLIRV